MKTSPPRRQSKSQFVVLKTVPGLLSPRMFWVAMIAVVVGIFAVYSSTLDFQFILDDNRFLADPRVQSSGHIWEYFTNYVWAQVAGGAPSFYRPIFVLWLRINFIFNEMSSWGWHFFSIGKHALVAVLLVALVWKLLRDQVAALIAGTLFALHPSHTESVAWVTVPDPLMAAAILGSVLLYFKYLECFMAENNLPKKKSRKNKDGKTTRSSVWLVASAVACFVALLSKESAIILPAIFFVLALALGHREESILTADNEKRGGFVVARAFFVLRQTIPFLCATVLYFLLRLSAFHGQIGALTQHLPLRSVLLFSPLALWFYVKVLLWPVRSYAFGNTDEIDTFSLHEVLLPALSCDLHRSLAVMVRVLGVEESAAHAVEKQLVLSSHCC